MKVVHLVNGSLSGGAARGAYWLHKGLLAQGVDSKILLNYHKNSGDQSVVCLQVSQYDRVKSFLYSYLDKLLPRLYPQFANKIYSTGLVGKSLSRHPLVVEADIIHLHWVNHGYVSLSELAKFNKPIVWTVRDMWPITGGCHYSMGCERYKSGCGNCPQLGGGGKDLSYFLKRKKERLYKSVDIDFVGIGSWIYKEAKSSLPLPENRFHLIGNTIDSDAFSPINKKNARKILATGNRKTVLVGANNSQDFYKGGQDFYGAIDRLLKVRDDLDFQVLVFGEYNSMFDSLGCDVVQLGYLSDVFSLRLAYSAADVFVAPSHMETFGKTIAESLACGTPVVAYNATGPKDIVLDGVSGFLAAPYSVASLSESILKVLDLSDSELDAFGVAGREWVVDKFSPSATAAKYAQLYEKKTNVS